ncbi:MAG: alpha/beta hydrolase [Elusimicrobia bacterium]|nr:alpha/beta hydrolase [Elusimicrobiota bacterium]
MKLTLILLLVFSFIASAQTSEFVTFKADDDWQIHAKYSNPQNNKSFFLLLHAQKTSHTDFTNLFYHLQKHKYGYLALDLRGHGSSIYNLEGTTETYKTFALSGADNQFNKMARDIEGAIKFLASKEIGKERLIVMGSLLGANLAIKTAAIHQEVQGAITLSAVLNVNDVLSVNPMKAYGKRPLLFISGTDNKRQYKEFQLLENLAKRIAGEENVTTIIARTGLGASLLTSSTIGKILAWTKYQKLPTIVDSSTSTVNIPLSDIESLEAQEEDIIENNSGTVMPDEAEPDIETPVEEEDTIDDIEN